MNIEDLYVCIHKNVMKYCSWTHFVFHITAIYKYCSMDSDSERASCTFMRLFGPLTTVYFLTF